MDYGKVKKGILLRAMKIHCNKQKFLERIEKEVPLLDAINERLKREEIDYRIITKEKAPYVKLRIDLRPQPKEDNDSYIADYTWRISRLVDVVHRDETYPPDYYREPEMTEKEWKKIRTLLNRRSEVIRLMYEIINSHNYFYSVENTKQSWLKEAVAQTCPALANLYKNKSYIDPIPILFGDPLNHCGLKDDEDWDIRKQSENWDDPDDFWWDDYESVDIVKGEVD